MDPTVWNRSFFPEAVAREGAMFLFMVLPDRLPGLSEALLNPPVSLIGLPSPGEAMVVPAPPRRGAFKPALYGDC